MYNSKISEEPQINKVFIYSTFLFLGVAILLPWNSLIMALDYFIKKLPGHDVDFVVSILSNGPAFLSNALMIIFHKYFPPLKTIVICLMLTTVLTITLPLLPQYIASENARWILVFMNIILMTTINGIMQSC